MTRTRTRLRWHRPCRNAPTADAPGKFIQRQVGNSDGISIPPTPVIATDRFPAAAPGIRPARRCRDRDYDRASQSLGSSNAARPGSALRPHLVGNGRCHLQRWQDDFGTNLRAHRAGIERVLVPQHRLGRWSCQPDAPGSAWRQEHPCRSGIRRWRHHRRIRPTTVRRHGGDRLDQCPHLHGDPIAPRHRQPRLGSDRSFRRRLGDHRQRGRIGRKPPVVPLPGALVEQWLDHGHAPPGASRRLELHRRSHLRRRLGHRWILLQRFRAARRHLDQWLRHRDRPGRQLRPVFRRDRHFRQWRRHRGLVRAIQ